MDPNVGQSQSSPHVNLQFVTGHYQSSEERRRARTLIRTHAANVSRWRQWTRLVEQHDARSLTQLAPPSRSAYMQNRDVSIPHPSQNFSLAPGYEDWTSSAKEQYEAWLQQSGYVLSIEHFFDILKLPLSHPVEELSVLPKDVTLVLLQQGRFLYSLHVSPAYSDAYQCDWTSDGVTVYSVLDQTFLPSKQSGYNHRAVALLQQALSDVGLLHGFIFSQLVRNKAAGREVTNKSEYEILACHNQVVKYVNSRLGDPETMCDDCTMLAVCLLAYSGKVTSMNSLNTGPTQGPLKSLQLLDLYGGVIHTEPTHQRGLARMLQHRGGISRIAMPGFAQMLSYGNTIIASLRLTRPALPFVPHFDDDHDKALRSLRRPDRPLSRIGIGFRILGTLVSNDDVQPLQTALQRLSLYALAVEDYITGSFFSQSLAVLADQRNLCQHGLLSLIPGSATTPKEQALIYVVRIAATIYSLLVLYPIPSAPFKDLAHAIKTASTTSDFSRTWREAPELAVWIIFMGAIAAIGTDDRTGFVAIIDRCLSRLKIDSWDALKKLLGQFLWLPSTNDADGYDLWLEIEESSPFKLDEGSAPGTRVSSGTTDNQHTPSEDSEDAHLE